MKKNIIKAGKSALAIFFGSIIIFACNSNAGDDKNLLKGDASATKNKSAECPKASEVINNWPEKNKKAAQTMIEKYGEPKVVASDRLIWEDSGDWKTTKVYKEQIEHNFPVPHQDFVEQTIDYKVPPTKFDELAMYDGSVIVDRTKGTITARCDKEAMNFLALNLANDIVKGKKTVEQARQAYAKTAMDFMNGEKPALTQELQFTVAKEETADPDKSVKDKMKATARK